MTKAALSSQQIRATLGFAAQTLDGIEDLRIATENRVRQMTRSEPDSDGVVRGLGMGDGDVISEALRKATGLGTAQKTLDDLLKMEHQATLELQRQVRQHPVYPLIKNTAGLGEKQTGRLLAAIGDPYWNDLHERPRTVSELWAYCGYSVINGRSQRRQKGQHSNWSATAKMRAFLIAESCVKGTGPYRAVYDEARAKYAEETYTQEYLDNVPHKAGLVAGDTLTLGHQHARALRAVAKEVLRDLWIEAKRAHEANAS